MISRFKGDTNNYTRWKSSESVRAKRRREKCQSPRFEEGNMTISNAQQPWDSNPRLRDEACDFASIDSIESIDKMIGSLSRMLEKLTAIR